jgi:DNA-binding MarR family transcriptional regulator
MDERREAEIEALDQLAFNMIRQVSKFLPQVELSKQQMVLLLTLYKKKRCTVSDLANELGLSASATTIAINRLVKSGYLIRTRDDVDRRVVWVELSGKAIQLAAEFLEKRRELLKQMLDFLTTEEIVQLNKIIQKVLAHLEAGDAGE